MAKYYISSGQIKHVIDRDTHSKAIKDTLSYYKGKGLMTGPKICISESGWTKGQICYDIGLFLKGDL